MTSTTPILDTFNRANEGPPPSASWTNINAGLKVVSNLCAANASNSVDYYNVTTYGPNAEVFCEVTTKPTNGQSIGIYLRLKDVGSVVTVDGYVLFVFVAAGTDSMLIQRVDNGVATTLGATISQETTAGDKILLRIIGTTLFLERNESLNTTRTDSTYTAAGYIGAAITDTTGRIDNFGGGIYAPFPPLKRLQQKTYLRR